MDLHNYVAWKGIVERIDMKILILGSSGFVGRNMYEYFNDKYDVKAPKHNELDVAIENDVYTYLKKKYI